MSRTGAVFVDIDGTLVPRTSSALFLADRLGHHAAVADAEAAYAIGAMGNREVSEIDAAGWTGASEDAVDRWLRDLPLVAGIGETVDWCRRNALVPVLASLAWSPVGRYLSGRFGFESWCGPSLATADGRFTGRVAGHFDEHDKRAFALRTADDLGVDIRSCVAIGDGRSDIPLFGAVGLSIAFNATADARAAATVAVDGEDLRGVLPILAGRTVPPMRG